MVPVYRGVPRQYGQGLGSLFKSMVKNVKPLLAPVVKTAARNLKQQGLKHGMEAASNILQGHSAKSAIKKAAIGTLKSTGKATLGSLTGSPHEHRQGGKKQGIKKETPTT